MKVTTELWDHQKECVAHLKRQHNAGFLMQYGTGKTISCLKWLEGWQKEYPGPTLIICKKDNIITWEQQIQEHTDSVLFRSLTGTKVARRRKLADFESADFIIINYEGVKVLKSWFYQNAKCFHKVVLDESLCIKDVRTQRSKLIVRLFADAKIKAIMCGKILSESLMDIYGQMRFLDSGRAFGKSFFNFRDTYFTSDARGWIWWPKYGAEISIAKRLSKICFIKLKKDCLKLPPIIYKKVYPELTSMQERMYSRLLEFWELKVQGYPVEEYNNGMVVMTKAHQILSGFLYIDKGVKRFTKNPKLKAIHSIIVDSSYKKAVIWCKYTEEIFLLKKTLAKLGEVYRYHGILSDKDKVENLRRFRESDHAIMLMQVDCGAGLNDLVSADLVIYMSNPFSWDKRDNSEARTYRIGSEQHEKITVVDLVCVSNKIEETLDMYILKMLRAKRKVDKTMQRHILNFVENQRRPI